MESTSCTIWLLVMTLLVHGSWSLETRRSHCPPRLDDPQPSGRIDTSGRLAELRQVLRIMDYDAFIITTDNRHQSEEPAPRDLRHVYVSGFTGSYAVLAVTRDKAAFWTDGRYFIQAEVQLSCDWILMKIGRPGVVSVMEWLVSELPKRSRIGADPNLIPNTQWIKWLSEIAPYNVTLHEAFENPVDRIWNETTKRPFYPEFEAYSLSLRYAGKKWEDKVKDLRKKLEDLEADAMVVTALDEVAWLLNIRGYDIPFYPFVHAYVIVSAEKINLYINESKLSVEAKLNLKTGNCYSEMCVRLRHYEAVISDLKTEAQSWRKVLLPSSCSSGMAPGASRSVYSAVPRRKQLAMPSPIIFMKARKNPVEIDGMRKAHIRDAVALCDFLAHFEESYAAGMPWDELNVSLTLDQFRREQPLAKGPSFPTIAGFGSNGAAPHYTPTDGQNVLKIDDSSTLVLDSGGQYLDGTTDVTRTIHLGTPTDFEREVYTRVLIGSIQLASLIFPKNAPMNSLDVMARGPLWQAGLDYLHGTGHGIGAFLAVHEAPIRVSYTEGNLTFQEGYFFSDEPGYYEEGKFGVRLENILEVIKKHPKHQPDGHFLSFQPVTYVPYEPKLIDISMLSLQQRRWLNDYNAKVRTLVGAELKKQRRMKGFYWMMDKTGYIPEYGSMAAEPKLNMSLILLLLLTAYAFPSKCFST